MGLKTSNGKKVAYSLICVLCFCLGVFVLLVLFVLFALFALFVLFVLFVLLALLVRAKSFCKKKKDFKTALMISFTLLFVLGSHDGEAF